LSYACLAEQTQKILNEQQQNNALASQRQVLDDGIKAHYERADSLNISNYDALEKNARETLGEDFIKAIIANTDDSARIIASIGASPVKAAELSRELQTNPTRAFTNAVRFEINKALIAPSLKQTPDPEEQVSSGSGISLSATDKKLEKLRETAAKTGNMAELMAYKRNLRGK